MYILWANFRFVQACRICFDYHVLRLCVSLLDKQKLWMKFLCENLRGGCMFLIARLAVLRVTDLGADVIVLTVILSDKADNITMSIAVKDKSSDVTFRGIQAAGAHSKQQGVL